MLARSRFGKIDDCNLLLSNIVSNSNVHSNILHEWVHPLTLQGRGAYPFRTGISSMRITAMEFLSRIESNLISSVFDSSKLFNSNINTNNKNISEL